MKKIFISIFTFEILFNLIFSSEIISLDLQYFYNITFSNSLYSIFEILDKTYLYTFLKVGDLEYNIKAFVSMENYYFSMSSKYESIDVKDFSQIYSINKSSTFRNISLLDKYYIKSINDIAAKEKFKINSLTLNDLDFIYETNNINMENTSLVEINYMNIGLQILSNDKFKFNFISLLKERKIINNYNWFVLFDKLPKKKDGEIYSLDEILNNKPKLLIGVLPHVYDPKKFNEKQIVQLYSNNFQWVIYFKYIYYFYKNNTNTNTISQKRSIYGNRVEIDFNNLLIYGPSLYYTYIERDFFNEYLSLNICHIYTDDNIEGIFCEKSENFGIENLKLFPTLYFEYVEINYTFEFNYQDLFLEKDNKFWFLIVIDINTEIDEWYIGFSLLKKYQFVFNQDSKTIGFYNPDLEVETNRNSNSSSNKYILYIIIFISWIVFICIGFFIGKYFYKKYKTKKRANELDDNYEYLSGNNINEN